MKENFEAEILKPNSNIVYIGDVDIEDPGVFAVNLDNILYIKKIKKSINSKICEFIILEFPSDDLNLKEMCVTYDRRE